MGVMSRTLISCHFYNKMISGLVDRKNLLKNTRKQPKTNSACKQKTISYFHQHKVKQNSQTSPISTETEEKQKWKI
jgi:hypothetical protein